MSLSVDEVARLEEILAALGEVRAKLYPRARDFFDETEARYGEEGSEIYLSAPQWRWLDDLFGQFA